ncbi:MAG TPA: EamA family transporter, partial [Anaerolineales bacterium]|nr:EamA family transporter [Anaerolineales bacterium]
MMDQHSPPPSLSDTSPKFDVKKEAPRLNGRPVAFGGARVGGALLVAIVAVSTASIFIRYAQVDAPSLVIAALRLTCATLLLAPLALTRHRAELKSLTRNEITLGIISGVFLAIHFATWISSLEYTT